LRLGTRMANFKKPVTFVVQHVLQINDAQAKKQRKETITSAKFRCHDDPTSAEFEVEARFGSQKSDFLSVFVRSCNKDVSSTLFQFSVIDHEGHLLHSMKYGNNKNDKVLKVERNRGHGWPEMLALDKIKASKLAILCNLEYLSDASDHDAKELYATQLQADLIAMFESGTYADVTFLVQEKKLAAHKSVLASRSDYFKKMFDAGMQESASNQVKVSDVEPSTFKTLLRFLYSGAVEEEQFDDLAKLVAAAEKYGMDELKKICESTMRANLQLENVIDALLIADIHNCSSLLRDAKTLFKSLAKFLKNEDDWNKLAERPGLLLELLRSSVQ